ncbi:head-tail connector protein [Enterobacter hormaechei]|uniref:head-tail connector protein n=1 Tax=Enterobacter hormaechei TaxID=158836 RepID=UPI001BCC7360|nr:head-tail connector protein [Enterobacter hormaechei]
MLLSPEEIKAQLRLDEDYTDEDNFLELLGRAVQARTENYLNRRLYAADDGGVPEEDPEGLILSDDIRMGMLLLVTHFYENRSTVTEVEKVELPMSFNWLVGSYRYIPL